MQRDSTSSFHVKKGGGTDRTTSAAPCVGGCKCSQLIGQTTGYLDITLGDVEALLMCPLGPTRRFAEISFGYIRFN